MNAHDLSRITKGIALSETFRDGLIKVDAISVQINGFLVTASSGREAQSMITKDRLDDPFEEVVADTVADLARQLLPEPVPEFDPIAMLEKWARMLADPEKRAELGIGMGQLDLWPNGLRIALLTKGLCTTRYETIEWEVLQAATHDIIGDRIAAMAKEIRAELEEIRKEEGQS